jgi:hypothetical protein
MNAIVMRTTRGTGAEVGGERGKNKRDKSPTPQVNPFTIIVEYREASMGKRLGAAGGETGG